MNKLTYPDKVSTIVGVDETKYVTAENMNEIKSVVNDLVDRVKIDGTSPTTATAGQLFDVMGDTDGNKWELIGIVNGVYYWVINGKSISVLAGEVITAGSFCYIGSDGKAYLSDNTTALSAKSKGFIFRAMNAAANIDDVIIGCYSGGIVSSGLTTGDIYYLSTTGAITNTIPSTTGYAIRIIGYAISETILMIDIDNTYLVV